MRKGKQRALEAYARRHYAHDPETRDAFIGRALAAAKRRDLRQRAQDERRENAQARERGHDHVPGFD